MRAVVVCELCGWKVWAASMVPRACPPSFWTGALPLHRATGVTKDENSGEGCGGRGCVGGNSETWARFCQGFCDRPGSSQPNTHPPFCRPQPLRPASLCKIAGRLLRRGGGRIRQSMLSSPVSTSPTRRRGSRLVGIAESTMSGRETVPPKERIQHNDTCCVHCTVIRTLHSLLRPYRGARPMLVVTLQVPFAGLGRLLRRTISTGPYGEMERWSHGAMEPQHETPTSVLLLYHWRSRHQFAHRPVPSA